MEVQVPIKLHNKFEIEVRDAKTDEILKEGYAFNVILDQYFSRLLSTDSPDNLKSISFGTGTGTIDASRTTMFTYSGNKTATTVETVRTIESSYIKKTIALEPEEYVGYIFSEVGFSNGSTLTTHAMIKDSEGNPITIEKTGVNRIVFYATFYITLPPLILGQPAQWYTAGSNALLTNLLAGHGRTTIARTIRFSGMRGAVNTTKYQRTYGSVSTTNAGNSPATREVISNTPRASISSCNGPINLIAWENVFAIDIPHPGIWEEMLIEGVTLGVGDGVITDFDFPVPELVENSEKIYVNGILKTKGVDYSIDYVSTNTPNSCYNLLFDKPATNPHRPELGPMYRVQQGLDSIISASASSNIGWTDESGINTAIPWSQYEMMIDAGEPILPHSIYLGGYSNSGYMLAPKLWGSNDGVNWTQIFALTGVSSDITVLYTTYSTTAYRYWKFGGYSSLGYYDRMFGHNRTYFLSGRKMLRFNAPIAIDDVVTTDFKTSIIPKTSNFVLDINWRLKFDRGI